MPSCTCVADSPAREASVCRPTGAPAGPTGMNPTTRSPHTAGPPGARPTGTRSGRLRRAIVVRETPRMRAASRRLGGGSIRASRSRSSSWSRRLVMARLRQNLADERIDIGLAGIEIAPQGAPELVQLLGADAQKRRVPERVCPRRGRQPPKDRPALVDKAIDQPVQIEHRPLRVQRRGQGVVLLDRLRALVDPPLPARHRRVDLLSPLLAPEDLVRNVLQRQQLLRRLYLGLEARRGLKQR